MLILDNDNNEIVINRYSVLPNGDKYTRNGKYILKVACISGHDTMFKEYKPNFRESNYFDNMNSAGKRSFLESV